MKIAHHGYLFYLSLAITVASCGKSINSGQNQSLSATNFTVKANKWNLVSFPIFTADLDEVLPINIMVCYWDETRPLNGIYGYYALRDSIDSLRTGYGYWVKCSTDVSFFLDTLNEFKKDSINIILRKGEYGWNMIGNPYSFSIMPPNNNLKYLLPKNEDNSLVENILSKKLSKYELYIIFETTDWDTVTILEPWCGYFVKIDADSILLTLKKVQS
jgi:hypothetical protein